MELSKAIDTVLDLRGEDGPWGADEKQAIDALITHARRSLDAPKASVGEDKTATDDERLFSITTLARAINEMKQAIAEVELTIYLRMGDYSAAISHPLYLHGQARIAELRRQIEGLLWKDGDGWTCEQRVESKRGI